MVDIPMKWRVGHAEQKGREPDEFVPSAVPGAVQIDWAAAKNIPDWNREDNFKAYRWMEDCFWIYRAEIPKTDLHADEELLFSCGGIDYKYDVYLNGEMIYAYEGMFRPFELDVGKAAENGGELAITIYPIPKTPDGTPDTREEARESCKPAVSYGWDWHPRLVPSGIWDETTLRVVKKERILRAEVRYTLSDDLKSASITVESAIGTAAGRDRANANAVGADSAYSEGGNSANAVDVDGIATAPHALLRFRLYAPDGKLALESTELDKPIGLNNPKL